MDLITRDRRPTLPLPTRRSRRAERRRLARCDAVSARLAELYAAGGVLRAAAALIGCGWVQGAWYTVATPKGERLITAYDLRRLEVHPVTGACLVGSIVHAGGGARSVRSQVVQRTLDLTWHALRDDTDPPARFCPSPPVRTMRLLDLTRWNDAPGRTQGEVVELLEATGRLAETHAAVYRAEQLELTAAGEPLTPA